MPKRGKRAFLNVFNGNVTSSCKQCIDLRSKRKSLRRARTCAESQISIGHRRCELPLRMRRKHKSHGIILNMRSNLDMPHQLLMRENCRGIDHLFYSWRFARSCAIQNFGKFFTSGISNFQLEKESIELRFGKWIRSFLLDWILGRHNQKWFFQNMSCSSNCDAAFLHCFQER